MHELLRGDSKMKYAAVFNQDSGLGKENEVSSVHGTRKLAEKQTRYDFFKKIVLVGDEIRKGDIINDYGKKA